VDEATLRAMLLQNLELSRSDPERAHEMYHQDAVLEFPQSGERFVGVENFREWRSLLRRGLGATGVAGQVESLAVA
jgi:hypothetical protein